MALRCDFCNESDAELVILPGYVFHRDCFADARQAFMVANSQCPFCAVSIDPSNHCPKCSYTLEQTAKWNRW